MALPVYGDVMRAGAYFTATELACKHCGMSEINGEFVDMLDELREILDRPVILNSAYRCAVYDAEIDGSGRHVTGMAGDVKVTTGAERLTVVKAAFEVGFTGIGIAKTFVHLDIVKPGGIWPVPALWLYS